MYVNHFLCNNPFHSTNVQPILFKSSQRKVIKMNIFNNILSLSSHLMVVLLYTHENTHIFCCCWWWCASLQKRVGRCWMNVVNNANACLNTINAYFFRVGILFFYLFLYILHPYKLVFLSYRNHTSLPHDKCYCFQ